MSGAGPASGAKGHTKACPPVLFIPAARVCAANCQIIVLCPYPCSSLSSLRAYDSQHKEAQGSLGRMPAPDSPPPAHRIKSSCPILSYMLSGSLCPPRDNYPKNLYRVALRGFIFPPPFSTSSIKCSAQSKNKYRCAVFGSTSSNLAAVRTPR